jgi:hypothetical protein
MIDALIFVVCVILASILSIPGVCQLLNRLFPD